MILAQKIKDVALAHGKTISQIAEELGVAQSHVSRLINNERITLRDMEKLCDIIGCHVSDLFIERSFDHDIHSCPVCGARLRIDVTVEEDNVE